MTDLTHAVAQLSARALIDSDARHWAEIDMLIDHLPVGVALVDAEQNVRIFNRKARQMLDFPDSFFAGRTPSLRELFLFNARRGEYGAGDPEQLARTRILDARGLGSIVLELQQAGVEMGSDDPAVAERAMARYSRLTDRFQSLGGYSAEAEAAAPKKPAKLSFKDAHRLKEIEGLMETLPADIARHDATLSDPDLYARDPKAFDRAMTNAARARAQLEAIEAEWLELEEKKAALEG